MTGEAHSWSRRVAAAIAWGLVLLSVASCSTSDPSADSSGSRSAEPAPSTPAASGTPGASASEGAAPSATPSGRQRPQSAGPAVAISSIAPETGARVGVAMPISVVFSQTVSPSQHRQVEKHLDVTTSVPVSGAWHWFGTRRVDFRAKDYWKPGTRISLNARLGQNTYDRRFTVGADVRTHVYVKGHKTVVTKDGKVIRSMSSNAGSAALPTWTGTMAVVNTSPTVRMDSCSVGIACSPGDPDYYDLELPWDVRITWSGTFLHYSTGDPNPGGGNGSHGCVHLSLADAEWFYHLSKPGDPVTVTGSPRPKADADNGYAGFNLSWRQWVDGSATGGFTTRQI